MKADQTYKIDTEIGTYGSNVSRSSLMKCVECEGLYIVKKWDRFFLVVDPEPAPRPLSRFEKEQETALARMYKAAIKEDRLCSCGGVGAIKGVCASEVDPPRDYVVEELVELIRSPRRIGPTAPRRHHRRRSRSR